MRYVIYAVVEAAGDADRETALWDREVDRDIARCRANPRWSAGGASWNDYLPVAVVETSHAVIVDGLLSWGGSGMTAREVLILDRAAQDMHGVHVTKLDDRAVARGGAQLREVE